ncbi:hypothetical protein FPQ18DRAFT_388157 [Pyronema domesticum]|nr:hypothetical protein FPQ18DRAFT_388157 [Pyronema domesticum]
MGSKALDLAMIFVTLFLLIIFSVVFIVRYFRKAYHLANDPENRCVYSTGHMWFEARMGRQAPVGCNLIPKECGGDSERHSKRMRVSNERNMVAMVCT